MRKLFLLIPALVLSLAINAAVINIDNTTPNAVQAALNSAASGDIIEMAAGTYEESGNYLAFTGKELTVRAAEGAEVIIRTVCPVRLKEGAKAEFINVKFDCSTIGSYDYVIVAADDTENKRVVLTGCEFYGWAKEKAMIEATSSRRLDAITIDNCYFHDCMKSVVFVENTGYNDLSITNSTFANIATSANFSAGVIDSRATTGSFLVDHCTFYDVQVINTDYAAIGNKNNTPSGSVVSNCIFAMPSSVDGVRAIRNIEQANNCLTFNYIKDGGGIYSSVTKNNCILNQDPRFTDAEHADYTFPCNWVSMNLSPACAAATNGSDLGDPRWYSEQTLPSADLTTSYALTGNKAILAGNIWYDGENEYLYGDGGPNIEYGTARWKLHAETAGVISVAANLNSGNTSGHKLRVNVFDAAGNGFEYAEQASTLPGSLIIPEAGDYVVVLHEDQTWSSAKIDNVSLAYVGGAVQAMPGTTDIDEAWFSAEGTRADGKIDFPNGTIQNGFVKWNVAFASTANYDVNVTVNSNNCKNYTVALLDANGNDVVTPLSKSDCSTIGTPVTLEMGSMAVPAGNYILKVTNGTKDSDAELISVQFVRKGGGLINIPDDLTFDEVVLSERALVDNDSILFTARGDEGHNSTEYAKWYIHANAAGQYKFTINAYNPKPSTAQRYKLIVLATNEIDTIATIRSAWNNKDNEMIASIPAELEIGNYIFKVQNTEWGSWGRLMSAAVSYEGGALVNLPNDAIPFADAILSENATRNLESNPQEIHFGSPNASQYAQWNIHAVAGLYTFTFDVVGTNYGTYKLDILEGNDNIFTYTQGKEGSGQVTISKVFIPAEGDYVLQLANTNSGANGYLTSLAATAATDVFVLDENTEDDGSIAAAAETGEQYTFLIKRSFTAGKYYTICLPVSSWNDELKLAFGADYELWAMSSATQSGDEIALNFEQINGESFHAGMPYIIKPSVDVVNPIFYNKKQIKNSTYNNVQEFAAADFIGTFYKDEIPAGESNLYMQNNNLYYSESNNTPIKGMRAWIRLKPQGAGAAPRARIVMRENGATAIDLVNDEHKAIKRIENGQVVILRDGIRYSVMGAKLQ